MSSVATDSPIRLKPEDKTQKCFRDLIFYYSKVKTDSCNASGSWVEPTPTVIDRGKAVWQGLDKSTQSGLIDAATMLGNYMFADTYSLPLHNQLLLDMPDNSSLLLKYSPGTGGDQYTIEFSYTFK